MRGTVLADANRIVAENVNRRDFHQRRKTNHGLEIIAEDKERRAVGDKPAVQQQTVGSRRHSHFAHAEAQIPPAIVVLGEVARALENRLVRRTEVGTAANQIRQEVFKIADDVARSGASGLRLIVDAPKSFVVPKSLGVKRRVIFIPKLFIVGELRGVVGEELIPLRLGLSTPVGKGAIMFVNVGGNVESFFGRVPAEIFLERDNIFLTERLTVRRRRTLLGAAVADFGLDGYERRARFISLSRLDSRADCRKVVAVLNRQSLEAERRHALSNVLRERQIGGAFD